MLAQTNWWCDCYRLYRWVSEENWHTLYILARLLPLPFWHPRVHLLAPQCCAAPLSPLSLQGVKSRPPLEWWMSLKLSSYLPIVHLNTGNQWSSLCSVCHCQYQSPGLKGKAYTSTHRSQLNSANAVLQIRLIVKNRLFCSKIITTNMHYCSNFHGQYVFCLLILVH